MLQIMGASAEEFDTFMNVYVALDSAVNYTFHIELELTESRSSPHVGFHAGLSVSRDGWREQLQSLQQTQQGRINQYTDNSKKIYNQTIHRTTRCREEV